MATRACLIVAVLSLAAGAPFALAQDKPAEAAQPKSGFPPATPTKGTAPVVASDAKAALDAAVRAMTAAKWISYSAKVEGLGLPGEFTAKVVLERADAGGWKISLKGQQKNKSSGKGRPIEVAFDGAKARSLRDLDKQVGELSDPADVEETMLFFAKEKAAAPIAWETLGDKPLDFMASAPLSLEPAVDVEGEKCNVLRVTPKDAKPAGEGADAFSGLYYFSAKDGLLRRIDRLRPNAKPGDKPVRTVTFTEVAVSEEPKGGDFVIQTPKGYTVKAETGKKALKPVEKAKEDTAKEAKGSLNVGDKISFEEKDLEGKTVRFPEDYKGKIVMIDFWATWCGPCMAEMPNVVENYRKFNDKGFDILGVTLDKKGDEAKIKSTESRVGMAWNQIYDGGGWKAKLAVKYGINSIPRAVLVDGDTGEIIDSGGGLRGEALAKTIEKALEKKKAKK